MRVEIKRLQKKLGITTLFVTHDQEECFSISDKVAVMNGGVIEQYDTPENIYRRPATEFVARFIGFENFLDVEKKADHLYVLSDGTAFKTAMDLDGGVYGNRFFSTNWPGRIWFVLPQVTNRRRTWKR